MKTKIHLLVIVCLIGCSCKKQLEKQAQNEEIKPFITDSIDSLVERWDIEHYPDGAIMFLDIPYNDEKDSIEYLTIAILCKDKKIRPISISFVISNNIFSSENGIKLLFANYIGKGDEIVFDENDVMIPFVESSEEDMIARIENGYITDESEKIDIFQKFLDNEIVFFDLKYPNGELKSIMLHLFDFQNQYRKLKEERSMLSE